MSVTALKLNASTSGGGSFSGSVTDSASTVIAVTPFIPAGTAVAFPIAFVVANLAQVFLVADQPLTILVNSSGSPTATINLPAGVPLRWSKAEGFYAQPFGSSNVTTWYFTNTLPVNLKGYVATS